MLMLSSSSFLHNPYYFCCCSLYEATRDQPKQADTSATGPVLSGSIVSSLHRLKDLDNSGMSVKSYAEAPC